MTGGSHSASIFEIDVGEGRTGLKSHVPMVVRYVQLLKRGTMHLKRSAAVATPMPKTASRNISGLLLPHEHTSSTSPSRGTGAPWHLATGQRAMAGLPADYRGLWAMCRKQIIATAKRCGLANAEVISELKKQKALEAFSNDETVPEEMSWNDTLAYLGLNAAGWRRALRSMTYGNNDDLAWCNLAPMPARNGDDLFSQDIIYWGPSLYRLAQWLDTSGQVPVVKPSCPRRTLAFKKHIDALLEVLQPVVAKVTEVAKPKLELVRQVPIAQPAVIVATVPEDPWPKGLPKDYNGVVAKYGSYVHDQVQRASKIKTSDEINEVCQEVWVKLIKAEVLRKFAETAMSKLPSTMTFPQCLVFLGVTSKQFVAALKKAPFSIKPVQGIELADDSLYSTAQIETLDASGLLPATRNPNRCRPEATERGFKSYLATAVKNHFKNLIRYRKRRHQERGLDSRVVLSGGSSGVYSKTMVLEEASSWEGNIPDDSDMPMEAMLDLVDEIRRHDILPNSDQGMAILDCVVANSRKNLTLRGAMDSVKGKVRVGE